MASAPKFHVREVDSAAGGDGEFIIAAFDSALPYLASIGSHEQWGLTPFSERDGWTAETMQQIKEAGEAAAYRSTCERDAVDALRIFIVETEVVAAHQDLVDGGGRGTLSGIGNVATSGADDGRVHEHALHSRSKPGQGKHVVPVGFAFIRENKSSRVYSFTGAYYH